MKGQALTSADSHPDWRRLQQLGLNAYEARSYVALMSHPRSKALELAAGAFVPRQKVYEVLESLVEKGFAEVVQEKTKLFFAVAPSLAIPSYLAKRSRILQQHQTEQERVANALIEDLRAAYEAGQGRGTQAGQLFLVNDVMQMSLHYRRMMNQASSEYSEVWLPSRAQYRQEDSLLEQATARGLVCRLLVKTQELDEGHRERLTRLTRSGIKIRVSAHLPLQLALFDRRFGLVAVQDSLEQATLWSSILFEQEGLAEAVCGLFESYWTEARADFSA